MTRATPGAHPGGSSRRALSLGVFDLFHIGHLRYLQAARRRTEFLMVAVTPDAMAGGVKGRRPVVPEQQRLEIVNGLACVGEARLQPVSTIYPVEAARWIADWGIDLVIAGGGWKGTERWDRMADALAPHGIAVEYGTYCDEVSTTALIERIRARD